MTEETFTDIAQLAEYYHDRLTPAFRSYLLHTGVTEETIELFQIGADEPGGRIGFSCDEDDLGGDFTGRLVFPVRDLEDRVVDLIGYSPQLRPKYKTLSGSTRIMYNRGIIEPSDPVFLCDGVLDAVLLTQHGHAAAAVLEGQLPARDDPDFAGKEVFLVFSGNYAGRRNAMAVAGMVAGTARAVYVVTLPEGVRGAADLFALDEDAQLVLAGLVDQARRERRFERFAPDTRNVDAFVEEVLERKEGQSQGITTGFPALDRQLLGGLREGLYLLASTPGMGKTTLLRQLADQVAATAGIPVLFLSMEMSAFELWAKSIAREMELPAVDILNGRIDAAEFRKVTLRYAEVLKRVWTMEGNEATTVASLSERAMEVHNQTGMNPVVVIDGLQRLPLSDSGPGAAIRPAAGREVEVCLALKHMARRLGCAVVATVSLNRESRDSGPSGLAAELVDVEHIADVVALLRVAGSRTGPDVAIAEMAQDPSRMVLEILKNRNGTTGSLPLLFYKVTGRFVEGSHSTSP